MEPLVHLFNFTHTLESLVLMIARRNNRELLEKNWRKLSHLQFKEFIPDNVEDTFVWHVKTGLNHAAFPNSAQSWTELVKEASDISVTHDLFLEYVDILRFFILVCPHRANRQIVNLFDH